MYHLRFAPAAKGSQGALPCPDGKWRSVSVQEVSRFTGGGSYESTPILWDGRVYIGSRDGWFYCLGDR
jgi:outer membrane protein assembly factor BamB